MKIASLFASMFFLLLYCNILQAEEQLQAKDIKEDWIRVITPVEDTEVINKKPEVKAEFLEPISINTLMVILDETDITQLLTVTEKGFGYKPVMVLPAGMHSLTITAADKEGKKFQKNISFSTRHSETLEEAYIENEASVTYEKVIENPDTATSAPDSKVEGNLRSNTKVKSQEWQLTFNINLRYLDQSLPVTTTQRKGIDLVNYLFRGKYANEESLFLSEIGNVQINETDYTVHQLARRGGRLHFQYEDLTLGIFSVESEQVFGFRDGAGIGGTTDDQIHGVLGGVKLLDKRVEFKTIYVTGGEPGSSLGISTGIGAKKGNVLGLVLTSDFFENKIMTEFEADFSKFDPDTSDEFEKESDRAYKLIAGGLLNMYNYEAMYEYIGRDYAVVGNQDLQKDKQGVMITNGLNFGGNNINLILSRYNDNVEGDELFPTIVDYQGSLDYFFTKITYLPIGIGYQKSIQRSTEEPPDTDPLKNDTDIITGRINYIKGSLNTGFQTAYSLMNDRTATNDDTTTITYTITPSYNSTNISINPFFSLNQSKNSLTDVRTDTYTINFDVRTIFFRERVSFDVSGTYTVVRADDSSANNRNLNANFRLAYNIKGFLKYPHYLTIATRGKYINIRDKVNSISDRDEFTLLFVLAATMPFSF